MYHMLEKSIKPLIDRELENQRDAIGNLSLEENLEHFQQDGAPPHHIIPVRKFNL